MKGKNLQRLCRGKSRRHIIGRFASQGQAAETTLRDKARIDEILDQSPREEKQLLLTGSRAGMKSGV
jgi:hypothetical protein